MTKIILRKGSGVPDPNALAEAELALDIGNGALYSRLEDGAIHQLNDFSGSGGGGDSLWEQNGSDIYYNSGNVGINDDAPDRRLTVKGTQQIIGRFESTSTVKGTINFSDANSTSANNQWIGARGTNLILGAGNQERLTIDAEGNVGIGTSAPNKRFEVARLGTAETISGLDGNTALVVTKGGGTATSGACAAFVGGDNTTVVGITMGGLTDPRQSRILHSNIDDSLNFHTGNQAVPRLTIDSAGDATFSGTVNADRLNSASWVNGVNFFNTNAGSCGFRLNTSAEMLPISSDGSVANATMSLGTGAHRFKNAYFSGTVNSADGYFSGKVGIGMTPAMRLKAWQEEFEARVKADPEADKEAVLRDITDDAFGVMPTEEIVAEWMEDKAAGDALQVNGGGSFSGTVNATNLKSATGSTGIRFVTTAVVPTVDASTGSSNGQIDLGISANKWKDAHFSGTVSASSLTATNVYRTLANSCGIQFDVTAVVPTNNAGSRQNNLVDFGSTTYKWKNAHFAGTVNAGAFVGDGSGLTNLPSGGPTYTAGNGISISNNQIAMKGSYTGNFSATGTITGTDCIATSDERLKDNIATAPVGLIDHLKGREWDWLETREKGSGVVAQELEKVLPHLVHEDDEGMKSVSYNGLIAYLIEEVKALKAEVETLRNG